MKGTIDYKNKLTNIMKKLPPDKAKEVVDFANYLQWKGAGDMNFNEKVDNLWKKMFEQSKKSKYRAKDIEKLIEKTRKKK